MKEKYPFDNKKLWSYFLFEVINKSKVRITFQNPDKPAERAKYDRVVNYLEHPYGTKGKEAREKNYEDLSILVFRHPKYKHERVLYVCTVICENRDPRDTTPVIDTLTKGLARHYPNGLPLITRQLTEQQSEERSPDVTIVGQTTSMSNDKEFSSLQNFTSAVQQITPDNSDSEDNAEPPNSFPSEQDTYNTANNNNNTLANHSNTINISTNPTLTPIHDCAVDLVELPELGIVTITHHDPNLVLNAYNELRALEQYEARFFTGRFKQKLDVKLEDNAVIIALKNSDNVTTLESELLHFFPHVRMKKILDTLNSTIVFYEGDPNNKITLSWIGAIHAADIKNIIERHIPPQMKNLFTISPEGDQALSVRLNFKNRGEYPPLTDLIKVILAEEQKISQSNASKKRPHTDVFIDLTNDPPLSPRNKK